MAATAVAMQVNATRHNVHAMGIDGLVHAIKLAAALAHLLDALVLNDDRPTIDPTFGREHVAIINLSQHSQSFLSFRIANIRSFSICRMLLLRFF
jgi:hypothetical protein